MPLNQPSTIAVSSAASHSFDGIFMVISSSSVQRGGSDTTQDFAAGRTLAVEEMVGRWVLRRVEIDIHFGGTRRSYSFGKIFSRLVGIRASSSIGSPRLSVGIVASLSGSIWGVCFSFDELLKEITVEGIDKIFLFSAGPCLSPGLVNIFVL